MAGDEIALVGDVLCVVIQVPATADGKLSFFGEVPLVGGVAAEIVRRQMVVIAAMFGVAIVSSSRVVL